MNKSLHNQEDQFDIRIVTHGRRCKAFPHSNNKINRCYLSQCRDHIAEEADISGCAYPISMESI